MASAPFTAGEPNASHCRKLGLGPQLGFGMVTHAVSYLTYTYHLPEISPSLSSLWTAYNRFSGHFQWLLAKTMYTWNNQRTNLILNVPPPVVVMKQK